ncbi:MAG TPA: hypothetical protein DCE44_00565, partial [Verrucomicrobiales bacterium]|nr:hypothetical protein [Verrucomicrobiales bacterium]
RDLVEARADSYFYTLMRAYQFAKNSRFDVARCRQYGIHAQTARQVEDTYRQLLDISQRERLINQSQSEAAISAQSDEGAAPPTRRTTNAREKSAEPLLLCLTAGFIDQLAVRKDSGTLDCRLVEGRSATLVRESLVESPLLVAAHIREVDGRNGRLTLLALATAVRLEWLRELYPQHLSEHSVCTVDRLHKRVASLRETRFLDLVIGRESAGTPDPSAAGQALADAFAAGWFDLPQLNHPLRQFIARVNLLARIAPELEIPSFDGAALRRTLARAFTGLTLMKEAQAADLAPAFFAHLDSGQRSFLDEFLPLTWAGPAGQRLKLLYPEPTDDDDPEEIRGPEIQIKLSDCFVISEHPRLAEGRLPITMILLAPDQKRLGTTTNLPTWRAKSYPALRAQLRLKYGSFAWP